MRSGWLYMVGSLAVLAGVAWLSTGLLRPCRLLDVWPARSGDGKLIVEWNAYRYTRMEGDGVGLFAISRRGYGDEARDFLSGLAEWRADTINALAQFKTPTLSPAE